MSFNRVDENLNSLVFGFGTATSPSSFSTSEFTGFTMSGSQMRFVPRNVDFMPFSNMEALLGFNDKLVNLLPINSYAAVDRFIAGNGVKHRRDTHNSTRIKVSYKGSGKWNVRGTLYVNGNVVGGENQCPSVIFVGFQASGGNGGQGEKKVYVAANFAQSGGGGGAGAWLGLQISLPWQNTTETEVFWFVENHTINLYLTQTSSAFATINKGGDCARSYVDGYMNSGSGGRCSIVSLPSNMKNMSRGTFTNYNNSNTNENWIGSLGVEGGSGGSGGYWSNAWGIIGVDNLKSDEGRSAGHSALRSYGVIGVKIKLNNAGLLYPNTRIWGGTSNSTSHGGGGGGALMGYGGNNDSAAPTGSHWGGGGGGGNEGNSGKAGANGCIEFVW